MHHEMYNVVVLDGVLLAAPLDDLQFHQRCNIYTNQGITYKRHRTAAGSPRNGFPQVHVSDPVQRHRDRQHCYQCQERS